MYYILYKLDLLGHDKIENWRCMGIPKKNNGTQSQIGLGNFGVEVTGFLETQSQYACCGTFNQVCFLASSPWK